MKQKIATNITRKAHLRLFEALGGTAPAKDELSRIILWLVNYHNHVDKQYRTIVTAYNDLNRLGLYDVAENLHHVMEGYTMALVQIDDLIESAKAFSDEHYMTDEEYADA